jgi:hypothetical protein
MKKIIKNLKKFKIFVIGMIPLLWFFYRTGTKPSRIQYPCQQLSLKHSTFFLQSLLAIPVSERLSYFLNFEFSLRRFFKIVLVVLLIVSLYFFIAAGWQWWQNYQSRVAFENHKSSPSANSVNVSDHVNSGFQTASNELYDHRVVSIHSSEATSYDYSTGMHWEYINQEVISDMVQRGVMILTGKTNLKDAWQELIPYQQGEVVAIKVNFNNCWNCNGADANEMNNLAETINAVIDGLLSINVTAEKIWITDPSRTIGDRFRNMIITDGIQYYSAQTGSPYCNDPNYFPTDYVAIDSVDTSPISNPSDEQVRPSQVFVDADHLINIPLMKGHGAGWHTLGLKNHYGSVLFKSHSRSEMHDYAEPWGSYYDPDRHPIGDINNNPHIRDKTRLILGDSLYGHPQNHYSTPIKWKTFNDDSPNMLFFGVDPIAVESVMLDWMNEESVQQGDTAKIYHDELHYSDEVLSLGIHEHWDSFGNRQYSTIDYLEIDFDLETCSGNCLPLPCDQYLDCFDDVGSCAGNYYCCTGTCDEPCEDKDGDFYYEYNAILCPEGDDCDDSDPEIFPGAEEICDDLDNDCDGSVDEGFPMPEITPPIDPDAAIQGTLLEVTINGTDFQDGATCDFQDDIQVLDCSYQNENLIIATVELDGDAELGSRDVTISNPNCGEDVCSECFEVEYDCQRTDMYPDGRVDGLDLGFLGRAFGLSSDPASPFYEPDPWWWPADLDGSGQVDGDDLALLASYFGESVTDCN